MIAALAGPEATEDEDVEAIAADCWALSFLPWLLRWLLSVVPPVDEVVDGSTGRLVMVETTGSVVVVVSSGFVVVVLSDGPTVVVVVSGGDGPVPSGAGGATGLA